jgi:hypothetical protein
VYLRLAPDISPVADLAGAKSLEGIRGSFLLTTCRQWQGAIEFRKQDGQVWRAKRSKHNSQLFQCGLNVRELKEDGPIRDLLEVEHKADAPHGG